jgi:hypothetical protein
MRAEEAILQEDCGPQADSNTSPDKILRAVGSFCVPQESIQDLKIFSST